MINRVSTSTQAVTPKQLPGVTCRCSVPVHKPASLHSTATAENHPVLGLVLCLRLQRPCRSNREHRAGACLAQAERRDWSPSRRWRNCRDCGSGKKGREWRKCPETLVWEEGEEKSSKDGAIGGRSVGLRLHLFSFLLWVNGEVTTCLLHTRRAGAERQLLPPKMRPKKRRFAYSFFRISTLTLK